MSKSDKKLEELGYKLRRKSEYGEEWIREDGIQSYKSIVFRKDKDVQVRYLLAQKRINLSIPELEAIMSKEMNDYHEDIERLFEEVEWFDE